LNCAAAPFRRLFYFRNCEEKVMAESYRVLVADDEEVIRDACRRILQRAGHEVHTAADGGKALESLRNDSFDLVLLDIKMPVVDGFQIMNFIHREKPETRVLVITGYGTAETVARAVEAGAAHVLTKPFSPSELRSTISRVLDSRPKTVSVKET